MTHRDDPTEIPIEGPEELAPRPGGPRAASGPGGRSRARQEPADDAESAIATEELQDELVADIEELERVRDRLLRLQAEFDNFRKREARERAAAWARAKADLVQKVLSAIDDLHRVAELDPDSASAGSVIQGVELVVRKLDDILEREGLAVVGEVGEPFDPNVHEAIGMLPPPAADQAGRVAVVAQKGFRFGSQLLRPAQVQVYQPES